MKALKYLGIVFTALVLILAAIAAYLFFTFDAARVKQEAAQAVLAKTGRTLTIEGDVALRFWPSLGVKTGKVTLSERNSREEFARFDTANVSVQVVPLLSKRIAVDDVALDGLEVVLIRDSDGHLNIDDLLGNGSNDKKKTPPPEFDVASVRLTRAQLDWRDLKGKKGKEPNVVSVANLDLATGHIVSSLRGQRIDKLKLSTRAKFDTDNIDLALEVPAAAYMDGELSAVKAVLNAVLQGAGRKGSATMTVNDLAGNPQALKVGGIALDVDAQMGGKTITGNFKTPLALDLDAATATLPALSGTLAVDLPGLPARPLKLPLTGRLVSNYGKPAVSGNLATQFDESHVKARFNVVIAAPPDINLELDIDKLNVDKYLPPDGKAKQAAPANARIDLSALKSIHANGTLRVGELQVKNVKARNVRMSFKAAGGRASVAPHSADLYGGSANGALSLDANGNRVALKETLTGISIQPLLKDLAGKDLVEGRGDVALDVSTQGPSVDALKKSLSGSTRAVLRDGAIKGINIAQSLRNAKARMGGGDVTQQASAVDKTDFSELSASFRIASGVAHNDDLAAKSPFLRLAGSGDIDIGNSQLNYLLKAALVSTSAGQGGKEADALKGVTVPVRVSGPFEKPAFKLELANLVTDSAKARVEEKKQEVKQKLENKVQEQLGGKLKGLFEK